MEGAICHFWGDRAAYVAPPQAGRLATRLFGPTIARRISELRGAWMLFRLRGHYDCLITSGTLRGVICACLQTLVPWRRKPHLLIDCLWYRSRRPLRMRLDSWILKFASRSVTRFIVWASHEVDDYAEAFGIPREKLRYIPFFYTLHQYTFDVRNDGYVFAGGNYDRDYETVVRSAERLPDLSFLIATTRPEQLEGVTIPANVTVTGLTHAEFRQAMAAARLIIVPLQAGLLHSGGQQTCLNAMFMGKPTIAVGERWAQDFITNRHNGFIVDYQDPAALADTIMWIIGNPAEANLIGQRAEDHARQFTIRRCMKTLYETELKSLYVD